MAAHVIPGEDYPLGSSVAKTDPPPPQPPLPQPQHPSRAPQLPLPEPNQNIARGRRGEKRPLLVALSYRTPAGCFFFIQRSTHSSSVASPARLPLKCFTRDDCWHGRR